MCIRDSKYTNYVGIFRNPNFFSAFWNTIRLTLIASILTAICGQFLGYISSRGRGKWYGDLTEQMVFVPYLMSGIAFSTMYFSMFSRPHLGGLMPSLYAVSYTHLYIVQERRLPNGFDP